MAIEESNIEESTNVEESTENSSSDTTDADEEKAKRIAELNTYLFLMNYILYHHLYF